MEGGRTCVRFFFFINPTRGACFYIFFFFFVCVCVNSYDTPNRDTERKANECSWASLIRRGQQPIGLVPHNGIHTCKHTLLQLDDTSVRC